MDQSFDINILNSRKEEEHSKEEEPMKLVAQQNSPDGHHGKFHHRLFFTVCIKHTACIKYIYLINIFCNFESMHLTFLPMKS